MVAFVDCGQPYMSTVQICTISTFLQPYLFQFYFISVVVCWLGQFQAIENYTVVDKNPIIGKGGAIFEVNIRKGLSLYIPSLHVLTNCRYMLDT